MNDPEMLKLEMMGLHDALRINNVLVVLKVPGGWIYTQFMADTGTSTFVPEPTK